LKILFSHEYAHFLLNLSKGEVIEEKKLKWLLISEGIGTYFSSLVFPKLKMADYFLLRRDIFNWCQKNENYLRKIYCSGKYSSQDLIEFYYKGNQKLDLPPRVGKYIGYKAVKKYLEKNKDKNIGLLLFNKNLALSIEL
jgi:uncharacterized protein YjaZ